MSSFEETVAWLTNLYGGTDDYCSHDGTVTLYDRNRTGLRIAVFPPDMGHPRLAGMVCAETNKTFDKWTSVYYTRPYPQSEADRDQMLADLKVLCTKEHIRRANLFMTFDSPPEDTGKKPPYKNRKH